MFTRIGSGIALLPTALVCLLAAVAGCRVIGQPAGPIAGKTLAEYRRGFTTHLLQQNKNTDPQPQPPPGFELIHYQAPLGQNVAVIAAPAQTGAAATRHPALIWLIGGFGNDVGDTPWAPASPDNDQSARAFPAVGILTMYPALRGAGSNPGYMEGDFGEVDDVIAAQKYLRSRPDVDPDRIYLGGHSTGGTLALLVSEMNTGFRAVFAYGPVASVASYGQDNVPFDVHDKSELIVRAPILFLNSIASPTYVLEGTAGNTDSLHKMAAHNQNPQVHFYDLNNQSHFSELAATTPIVAHQIAADTGSQVHIGFDAYLSQMTPVFPR